MFDSWQQTSDFVEQEAVFANISGVIKLLIKLLLGTMPTFFSHWSSGVHLQFKDEELRYFRFWEKKFWKWERKIGEIWKVPTCNSLSVKNHIYLYSGNSEHGGGTSITSLSLQQILSSVGLFILKQSDFILLSVSTLPLQLGLGTQLGKKMYWAVYNLVWKNWSQIINLSLKKC